MTAYGSVMWASTDHDETHEAYIDTLIGEDESTFSARERAVLEKVEPFGEVYWCTVEVLNELIVVRSDLGQPGETVRLEVSRSASMTPKMVCNAMTAAIASLMA